ncbi:MAG: hypothetical protein QOG88_219 [Actinomycetota bacterium]|nr:hypothetical protein [Actinomycetota bacterium]
MHRSTARSFVGLLAVVVLASPLAAQAGSARDQAAARPGAASRLRVGALGVLPVRGASATAPTNAAETAQQKILEYHHGPVMHSSTTYAIYWQPTDCGSDPCTVASGYNNGINTYFGDAATDSGLTSNVYSTLNQYYDIKNGNRNHVQYLQTFGGSYVDTRPFPSNGCPQVYGSSGVCLSDSQIRKEVKVAMTAQGWTGGKSAAFFVMLPKEVDTCYAAGACAFIQFCAYHSNFSNASGAPVIYANIPYVGTRLNVCDSGKRPPNEKNLDATLNALSHEHREMTNDPFGNGWWDDQSGYEGSDQCAYKFGPDLGIGGPNTGSYNQLINGNEYLVQMEWSNKSVGCKQRGA